MIWTGRLGKIELNVTSKHARAVTRPGEQARADLKALAGFPEIKRQLNRLDPKDIGKELQAHGVVMPGTATDEEAKVGLLFIACKAIAGVYA